MSSRTLWKWWWGWEPEKVECWLQEMEEQGWNLDRVGFMAVRFRFKMGEKRKVRYCFDFQASKKSEYITLFEDAGWKLVWRGAKGWYLWACEYTDIVPEIFTEVDSLIERNNRLAKFITPLFAIQCLLFLYLYVFEGHHSDFAEGFRSGFSIAIFFVPFQIFCIVQLVRYNYKLLQRKNKY